MVLDTSAKELAKSVKLDRHRMERLWAETVPADRRTLTVLEGEKATAKAVLAHYDALKTSPAEGLVFYYAGHGARDEKTGKPFFDLRRGGPLLREELVRRMEAKKAGLVLLLTDCCSSPQELKGGLTEPRAAALPAKKLHPTVRCLLFQARGTVDVTAATDNASWSDNLAGGLFTRSLSRMLKQPVGVLDGDKDGFVSWREFYPQLRDQTQSLFGTWRKEMTARGERIDERRQVPHAYGLGRAFAVVGIENATGAELAYRWRWAGQPRWNDEKLPAGRKKVHALPLGAGQSSLPALEARFDGVRRPATLKAAEWADDRAPAELARHYRIRAR
jgi:hypothetical protein